MTTMIPHNETDINKRQEEFIMLRAKTTNQQQTETAATPVPDLLDRMGFTADLPERLCQDAQGRTFEPVQLNLGEDLVTQVSLLLRREPVGGAEPQIAENQDRMQTHALQQAHRFLAGGTGSPRSVVQEILHETRTRKATLEAQQQRVEQDYLSVQERLHPWQERMGKRSGSLTSDLWRWLIGGAGQLSLPEAGTLWNEREYLALRRAIVTAALTVADRVLADLEDLAQHLDDLLNQARRLQHALRQQAADLTDSDAVFAPWTVRIAPQVVSAALLERVELDGLVQDLLQRLNTDPGDTMLSAHVQTLARQAAARQVDTLSMPDMIDLDAQASGDTLDDDPVLLVGHALLVALQQPTWHLVRGARPRSDILQVTPDGTPAYSMDGLHSAAYGGDLDRLGFVQVQLGVALDDLALLRDTDESFQAALQQRNLYVLDDLARQAAMVAGSTPDAPPVPADASTNGQVILEAPAGGDA
jgi:hypothetical protein